MNCKSVKSLLSSYIDNEVSQQQREAIDGHVSVCPHCRAELEALTWTQQQLRQGLHAVADGASASPHTMAAVRARIANEKNKSSLLGALKSRIAPAMALSTRPAWQRAVAGCIVFLLVASLCSSIALSMREAAPIDLSPGSGTLPRFSSYEELDEFLSKNGQSTNYYDVYRYNSFDVRSQTETWSSTLGLSPDGDGGVPFSNTNIQVAGVDEADIVKTDGEFIYLVSGTTVYIVKAYPTKDASILARIELDERPAGIFINEDKLAVITNGGGTFSPTSTFPDGDVFTVRATMVESLKTTIRIYDVTHRDSPSLEREVAVDGWYCGSRMIGDYVYFIASQPVYKYNDRVVLPEISVGDSSIQVPATAIGYVDVPDYYYQYTTIAAVNTQKNDKEPSFETILVGATSHLYMSRNNLYLAIPRWDDTQSTHIHRIHIDEGDIVHEAKAEVPGRINDQFSMDEYKDNFRIATTNWSPDGQQNKLYVMDMELEIIGKLENLAPGETIYSARFMGERCYLVTFRQIDPFFVIDLADPQNPRVLGELKVTGYSSYLHPYDENHVIGIGMETGAGVKISIFDVSDVSNPEELARYVIGDTGTSSLALTEHKAVLFDRSKNLLVIPVTVAERTAGTEYLYYSYWQGAYVFDVSTENGLILRGKISHQDSPDQTGTQIQRSLYIDDVLYTISNAKIKMNDLGTLEAIGSIAIT